MTFQDDLKTELERAAAAVPDAEPGGMEHIRRRREQRRRVRYTGWALVSLLLVVGFLAVNLPDAPTNTPVADSQPVELPEGVIEVPASHPARQLIEGADSYGDFNRQARESLVIGSNVDFWACSLSGVGVCYVIADDIAAIATFDAPPDAVAVVTGPGVDGEVTIPLNTEILLGVETETTAISVSVRDSLGTELIGVESDWEPPATDNEFDRLVEDTCVDLDGADVVEASGIMEQATAQAERFGVTGPELEDVMLLTCQETMAAFFEAQGRRNAVPRDMLVVTESCTDDGASGTVTNTSDVTVDLRIDIQYFRDGVVVDTGFDVIDGLRRSESTQWEHSRSEDSTVDECQAELGRIFGQ